MKDSLLREYDADLRGTLKRLVRLGERHRDTGEPEAAPFSIEEVIRYLNQSSVHSSDHMAKFRLAAALEVAYSHERYKRSFPAAAQGRMGLEPVFSYLANHPSPSKSIYLSEKHHFNEKIKVTQALTNAALKDPYERLKMNFITATEYFSDMGPVDESAIFSLLLSIVDSFELISNHERHWNRSVSDRSWASFSNFNLQAKGKMKAAMEAISQEHIQVLINLAERYSALERKEIMAKCEMIKCESEFWTINNKLYKLKGYLDDLIKLNQFFDSIIQATSDEELERIFIDKRANPFLSRNHETRLFGFVLSLFSDKARIILTANLKRKQFLYVFGLSAIGSTMGKQFADMILYDIRTRDDSSFRIEDLSKYLVDAETHVQLIEKGLREYVIQSDHISELDSLGKSNQSILNYHFIPVEMRILLAQRLVDSHPELVLNITDLRARNLNSLVDRLIEKREYKVLFEYLAKLLGRGSGLDNTLELFRKTMASWEGDWDTLSVPVVSPPQVVDKIQGILASIHAKELKKENPNLANLNRSSASYANLKLLESLHNRSDLDPESATILIMSFRGRIMESTSRTPLSDFSSQTVWSGIDLSKIPGWSSLKGNLDESALSRLIGGFNRFGEVDRAVGALDEGLMAFSRLLIFDQRLDFLLKEIKELAKSGGELSEIHDRLTRVIERHPLAFARTLLNHVTFLRPINYREIENEEEISGISAIDSLVDWDKVMIRLTLSQTLCFALILDEKSANKLPEFNKAFIHHIMRLYKDSKITTDELMSIHAKLMIFSLESSSPALEELTKVALSKLDLSRTDIVNQFVSTIQPHAFGTTEKFIESAVALILHLFVGDQKQVPISSVFANGLEKFIADNLPMLDPLLKQTLLERIAEHLKVPASQRDLFQVKMSDRLKLQGLAETAHVWSTVFSRLDTDQQQMLLQFLRGKGSDLTLDELMVIRQALAANHIFLNAQEVGHYIKTRIESLSPHARASVFHMALSQPNGVMSKRWYREKIYLEVLDSFKTTDVKEVFLNLWTAGMAALPEPLRRVVLSAAYSESGHTGSPERALVTLFANMGPLVQKLGQSLAFEPSLPESYRNELERLWDQAQELSWWHAWDLIKYQHGDLEKGGYVLSRILNAGSTEAMLEVEHVQTKRKFVISVFRDGIKASVATDTSDLRLFAQKLIQTNPERYGFLQLLVEDNIVTIRDELDREKKRKASEEMRQIYARTIESLGGSLSGMTMTWKGLNFYCPKFVRIDLANGHFIYAQELADGVPLKSLKKTDFQEYKRVSQIILQMENQAYRYGDWIDKDRMPGQYLYNAATKTVFILDHGQARKVSKGVHRNFEPFMAKLFAGSYSAAFDLYTEMVGLSVSQEDRARIAKTLAGMNPSLRPLQALHLLSSEPLSLSEKDSRRVEFLDLVHAVRAKLRLAHWDASLGLDVIKRDLTKKAYWHFSMESFTGWVASKAASVRAYLSGATPLPPTSRRESEEDWQTDLKRMDSAISLPRTELRHHGSGGGHDRCDQRLTKP